MPRTKKRKKRKEPLERERERGLFGLDGERKRSLSEPLCLNLNHLYILIQSNVYTTNMKWPTMEIL